MRTVQNWFKLLFLACVFGPVGPVDATVLTPVTDRQLAKEAELILQGVVTKVEYRISEVRNEDNVRLPHTFVTYQIEKILKGSVSGKLETVTLRFLGGQDLERKRFLMVHKSPLFDVGDRDVLFVKRNGKHACPLVGWEQGRFRIIGKDEVYSDDGQEVWLTSQKTLAYGKVHPLPEVLTHQGGTTRLRRQVHSAEQAEEPAPQPDPIQGTRLSATEFINFIASLVATLHTPEGLEKLPPVESANPNVPFFVSELKPLPLPEEILIPPKPTTDEEIMVERTGNPVLPPARIGVPIASVNLTMPKTKLSPGDSLILDLEIKSGELIRNVDFYFSLEVGLFTFYLDQKLNFTTDKAPVVSNFKPLDLKVRVFGRGSIFLPSIFGEFIIPPEVNVSFAWVAEIFDSETGESRSKSRVAFTISPGPPVTTTTTIRPITATTTTLPVRTAPARLEPKGF